MVFRWKNIYVLGELKTGPKKEWKVQQWKCQMAIYMDVWGDLFPGYKILGVIIHRQLDRGYSRVNTEDSWLSQIVNPGSTFPGEHCDYCDYKLGCPDSVYDSFRSIR